MTIAKIDGPAGVPAGSVRRHATRYEPTRRDARLAWWGEPFVHEDEPEAVDGSSEPEAYHHFALLLDISQAGASVALDKVPRSEHGVWLRLEGDDFSDWTEADVVGVTTTSRGPHLVRLAFRAPCPFETLRAAVCG